MSLNAARSARGAISQAVWEDREALPDRNREDRPVLCRDKYYLAVRSFFRTAVFVNIFLKIVLTNTPKYDSISALSLYCFSILKRQSKERTEVIAMKKILAIDYVAYYLV